MDWNPIGRKNRGRPRIEKFIRRWKKGLPDGDWNNKEELWRRWLKEK